YLAMPPDHHGNKSTWEVVIFQINNRLFDRLPGNQIRKHRNSLPSSWNIFQLLQPSFAPVSKRALRSKRLRHERDESCRWGWNSVHHDPAANTDGVYGTSLDNLAAPRNAGALGRCL